MPRFHSRRWSVVAACSPWLVAALFAAGCQKSGENAAPPLDAAAVEAQVKTASAAWDRAHNAGDLGALLDLYAADAVSMPFNRTALDGRAAIEADFRAFFDAYRADHRTEIVSVTIVDDIAIERGRYQLSAAPNGEGRAIAEVGKHVVIRRRVDGAWKIQYEIWNLDAPPVQ